LEVSGLQAKTTIASANIFIKLGALRDRHNRLRAKKRREQREAKRMERAASHQEEYHYSSSDITLNASHFPAPSQSQTASPSQHQDPSVQEAWAAATVAATTQSETSNASQGPNGTASDNALTSQFSFANALRTSAAEANARRAEQAASVWLASLPQETRVNRKGKKKLVLLSNQVQRRR
jgi:hypothetical protein